jgi:hypothetical protein
MTDIKEIAIRETVITALQHIVQLGLLPPSVDTRFNFVDLFAGVGGLRIMQLHIQALINEHGSYKIAI